MHPDDAAAYKYINFEEGVSEVSIRVKPGKDGGKINLVLNNPWEASVSAIDVPANGNSDEWITLTAPVSDVKGEHALWLKFSGEGENLVDVDWLQFHQD